MTRVSGYLMLLLAAPLALPAQVPAELTLDQAISIATRNNPVYQRARTARDRATLPVRAAYGAFLPSISSNFGVSYRPGGQVPQEGQLLGAASDIVASSYNISLSLSLQPRSLYELRKTRADVHAADEDVRGSEEALRLNIAQFFFQALAAQANVVLQDTLLASAQEQLRIAQARQQIGTASMLDVRNEEANVGRIEAQRLQSRNQAEEALLQLFEQMGVPRPPNVRIAWNTPVTEPAFALDSLLADARTSNPLILADEERVSSANVGVAQARSAWLPSIGIGTAIGGFTQQYTNSDFLVEGARRSTLAAQADCFYKDSLRSGAGMPPLPQACDQIVFTDAQAAAIRAGNNAFPFSFTRNPVSYGVSLSLPIFNGFQRENSIQNAALARSDARQTLRQQQLALVTTVTTAYNRLVTDYQLVQLQQRNVSAAREAMALAEERYRLGTAQYSELSIARTTYENASAALISQTYTFHTDFARLENAVGRRLR